MVRHWVTTRLLHQLIDKHVQAMWLMSCNPGSVGACQELDFEFCNYQANWLLLLWHCWGLQELVFSSILYGLLIFWHCWWLPGLLFSSQWAYDIFTLLGACQELGFELFYVQINGLLIKQWVFAVATWKHSCFRNVTCAWYHCIIQDQSVLYLCVIGSIPAWVKWVPLLLTWSVINLEVFGLLKCCMSTWHSYYT